jgi:hypothetical protein
MKCGIARGFKSGQYCIHLVSMMFLLRICCSASRAVAATLLLPRLSIVLLILRVLHAVLMPCVATVAAPLLAFFCCNPGGYGARGQESHPGHAHRQAGLPMGVS